MEERNHYYLAIFLLGLGAGHFVICAAMVEEIFMRSCGIHVEPCRLDLRALHASNSGPTPPLVRRRLGSDPPPSPHQTRTLRL